MLSEQDREWITLACRDGAFAAIREAEPDRRRLAKEEAEKVVQSHEEHCPFPSTLRAELKITVLRLILALTAAGTIGGTVSGTVVSIAEHARATVAGPAQGHPAMQGTRASPDPNHTLVGS